MNTTNSAETIDEDVLKAFVWSVYNFFSICTKEAPEVGTPFLFDKIKHSDFTGTIGVSGDHRGAIYLSIGEDLLEVLLQKKYSKSFSEGSDMKENEIDKADFAGEITNIISGNVRNYLGENFLISVPVVLSEPGTLIDLPIKGGCGIVFPITWGGNTCHLILNFRLEKQEASRILELLEP